MKESGDKNSFVLSEEDGAILLEIARKTVELYIQTGKTTNIDRGRYSSNLNIITGAFVSLHKDKKLRGCIGRFQPDRPLCELVSDLSISASTKDHRFKPLKISELNHVEFEISVLTPLQVISDPADIKLGKHGIYIKKGFNSGTFLPQVAAQTGWNLEEYLGHCARDKANIGWDGWKDAELFIYEAFVFKE